MPRMTSFVYDTQNGVFYCLVSLQYPIKENKTEVTKEQFKQMLKDRNI